MGFFADKASVRDESFGKFVESDKWRGPYVNVPGMIIRQEVSVSATRADEVCLHPILNRTATGERRPRRATDSTASQRLVR